MLASITTIVDYMRSWFSDDDIKELGRNTKRRADDLNTVECSSPKFRKVLSPMSNNIEGGFRREGRVPSYSRTPSRLSPVPAFSLECEDGARAVGPSKPIPIMRKPVFKNSIFNDIRSRSQQNGSDDLVYVRSMRTPAEKKAEAHKTGFSYITRFSPNLNPTTTKTTHNGTPVRNARTSIGSNSSFKSPTFNYSFDLEEKRRYSDLLSKVGQFGSFNNTKIYDTPGRKASLSPGRGKQILDLVRRNRKSLEVVDLTDETSKPRLSTKEAVIKVLDDFDDDVKVEDYDSDVEILPTPPSPKPDIKVDPINTLQTVIDTSKATKPEWISAEAKRYESYVASKSREIEAYSENSSTLGKINQELLLKSLAHRVKESLAIKDTVLPVEEEEEDIVLPALSDEQLRTVKRAFSGDPDEILSKKFNLNISRRDLHTLHGLNWLNDNVINFYMNLLIERGSGESKWPKVYAMNTFFYQKLSSSGPESLRRWTRRVDVFAHDFICVPVHLGVHWCMAIINLKEKTIKYYDSMGTDNNNCLYALRNYLEYEHMDKKGQPFGTKDFKLENVKDIPQQMNGSDCGMFACTFAEFATRRSRFNFSQKDMPYLRKKMVVEILTGRLLIQ